MGKGKGKAQLSIGLNMLILAIATGCAPAHFRAHPQLQEKVRSIKTVAIMPPGVKVYQLAVGGGTQLMDEETVAATQIVATAIEKKLERHAGVVFKPFPSPTAILAASSDLAAAGLKDELEETQALFEAVSTSVRLHTYGHGDPKDIFPEKRKNFDYSLGPEVQRLAKLADALLFVSGVDHISTGARKALMTTRAVIFLPILLHPFGFLYFAGALASSAGKAILSVALVDATTGALLWYNIGSGVSLTSLDQATDLAEQVFQDFPLGTRPTRKEDDQNAWPISLGPR